MVLEQWFNYSGNSDFSKIGYNHDRFIESKTVKINYIGIWMKLRESLPIM